MSEENYIYVSLSKKNGEFAGHSVFPERPNISELAEGRKKKEEKDENINLSSDINEKSIQLAIDDFISTMETYRNVITLTVNLSPFVSQKLSSNLMGDFVKSKGELIEETENFSVFKLESLHIPSLFRRHKETLSANRGAEHLFEIVVIGLISAYDAYLAKLLRAIFHEKYELLFTSDREIKYSDLIKFESISDAKTDIIEKEIEGVLRSSHHEQFFWMEKKFSLELRKDLDIWPQFIELCERRNLLTHTGGHISAQYKKVCKEHNYPIEL